MPTLEKITTISFDADGTLWDFMKVMRHSLKYVMKAIEEIDPRAAAKLNIDYMIKIRNKFAHNLKGLIISLEKLRLLAFQETLKAVGRPNDELAKYLNEIYLKHRFEDIELYDDVLPVLNELKKKYKIGILSNGNSYPEKCGLEKMFEFVVFSQHAGVEKPDPEVFEITMSEAGCKKEQILHVGDGLATDIIGANNAGVKCVWINRKKEKNTTNYKINYEITSLRELLDIL
ncbi:MAG: HAD family hydrolase [Candidatus Heimdallarchaeota archaeon]